MIRRFIIYGFFGLILETFWTAIVPIFSNNFSLFGRTSLWMLPIYGMVVLLEPLFGVVKNYNPIIRGVFYCICIFIGEYFSGLVLRQLGVCPWDYSGKLFNINGLIRLDYAPLWFAAGLMFERLSLYLKNFEMQLAR